MVVFFFFRQKTAYEIGECDWSSDVWSSDLKYHVTNKNIVSSKVNDGSRRKRGCLPKNFGGVSLLSEKAKENNKNFKN